MTETMQSIMSRKKYITEKQKSSAIAEKKDTVIRKKDTAAKQKSVPIVKKRDIVAKQKKDTITKKKDTKVMQEHKKIMLCFDDEQSNKTDNVMLIPQTTCKNQDVKTTLDFIHTNGINSFSFKNSDKSEYLAFDFKNRNSNELELLNDNTNTIICYDTRIFNTMIIYDKDLFKKYFKDIFDIKLLDSSISFVSNNDHKTHYFITITDIAKFESSILTIKYIETIVVQILCGIGGFCIGNETINNFGAKGLVIKYDTIQEMKNIMDVINPNTNKNYLDNVNKLPIESCNPYHFKINKIHTDYNMDDTVHNFRGMSCKYINDKKHVCKPQKWCGSFNYVNKAFMYKFIVLNEAQAVKYCMSECITPYFKYFVDLDFNDKAYNYVKSKNQNFNFMDFWDYIKDLLIQVLEYFIDTIDDKSIMLYIFSSKRECDSKIHLYFPNIVINAIYAIEIKKELIKRILIEDVYEIKDYIDVIIDEKPYHTSIRLLYQTKCGEKFAYMI